MPSSHAVRRLVAVRDFRRLLAVRLVGQLGDGAFQTALLGAAFFNPDKATSAAAAAAAFTVLLLPYSLIGPFAGIALDRWSRQRILLLANLLRAVLVVLVAVSLAHTGATSTRTLLLALATTSVNRFILSGLSASLPRVVEDDRLVTANALTTTLGTAAGAIGGILSVQLLSTWGRDDGAAARIALLASVTYALTALLAARIGRHRLGPGDELPLSQGVRHVVRGLVDGTQHLRARRAASRALTALAAQRLFSGIAFVMVLMLYTPDGFIHRGIGGLGQTVAAAVVGGLIAALVTPFAVRRVGAVRWIIVCLVAATVTTAAGLPAYTHEGLLVTGLGLGFTSQGAKICVDTLLQESIDDDFRGRVFAIYDMLFNVSFVAATAIAALIVPDNGHRLAVVVLVAGGYAATAAAYALVTTRGTASLSQ